MSNESEQQPDQEPVKGSGWPKTYVGSKIIQGEPMDHFAFLKSQGKPIPEHENSPGYKVTYEDGYVSWSPQNVFERCYREITLSEKKLL